MNIQIFGFELNLSSKSNGKLLGCFRHKMDLELLMHTKAGSHFKGIWDSLIVHRIKILIEKLPTLDSFDRAPTIENNIFQQYITSSFKWVFKVIIKTIQTNFQFQ